jgi:hypothetical protein
MTATSFTTSDGSAYELNILPLQDTLGDWNADVQFKHFPSPEDRSLSHMEALGGKQAFEVFKQVINILGQYLQENSHIGTVTFTADNNEPSRVSLYKKLSERFGTETSVKEFKDTTVFKVVNPYYQEPEPIEDWVKIYTNRDSSRTAQVYYHGTTSEFESPRLDDHGVFWLAFEPGVANQYAGEYYKQGNPRLLEITVRPDTNIVDLKDLNNPIIRDLKDSISKYRETTIGLPIRDENWDRWADFGIVEGYGWVRDFLVDKGVDGLVVDDKISNTSHRSIALFNLDKIENIQ